jgi:hypothetical protein
MRLMGTMKSVMMDMPEDRRTGMMQMMPEDARKMLM